MVTVVVAGAVANKPDNGGEAWVRLSWVRGLQRLGVRTLLWEQLDEPSAAAFAYFDSVRTGFGLESSSVLVDGDGRELIGSGEELVDLARSADLLLNISGHLNVRRLFEAFPRTALVDIDPGYTQIWHAQGLDGARVDAHDLHFTIGEKIGRPDCPIPTGGVTWRATRQPVVLDDWPVTDAGSAAFTTVASWRGAYGPLEHAGRTYGVKAHEFRKIRDLPAAVPMPLEIALSIHEGDAADRDALLAGGWRLTDPVEAAGTPERFRRYVQGSAGELSVAQGVYVDSGSGWFSDRTTSYLASGRPAVVQDSGFARNLPTGEGLLAFRSPSEAAAALVEAARDPLGHGRAARRIAQEHFDSDAVLTRFLEDALP